MPSDNDDKQCGDDNDNGNHDADDADFFQVY